MAVARGGHCSGRRGGTGRRSTGSAGVVLEKTAEKRTRRKSASQIDCN